MATTLKVVGAAWGRTGTTSTLGALNDLGFGPCYTFYTLMSERPDHYALWQDAYAGRPMDWPAFFAGYNSVVDWPASDFYLDLLKVWPDAKVILNVRDADAWYTSMVNTIWEVFQNMRQAGPAAEASPLYQLGQTMMWQGAFHGRFEDKDYVIGLYEKHVAEVKASLPTEKLLAFDVKDGWEPLCRFLNVPVPDKPFPRLNDTDAFRARVRENMARAQAQKAE